MGVGSRMAVEEERYQMVAAVELRNFGAFEEGQVEHQAIDLDHTQSSHIHSSVVHLGEEGEVVAMVHHLLAVRRNFAAHRSHHNCPHHDWPTVQLSYYHRVPGLHEVLTKVLRLL